MDNELIFKNILEVVTFLKTQGWKIQKSSAYRHVQEGKIGPEADGTYTEKAALKYAKRFLKRHDGTSINTASQRIRHDLEERKLAAQARIAEMKAALLEGNYIERLEFETALAKRALIFRNDLESFYASSAQEIIEFVKGDSSLIPDLIQFMHYKINDFLDRYADPEGVAPLPASGLNMYQNNDSDLEDGEESEDLEDE